MRRCLVLGGSGFLGGHLIEALLSDQSQETKVITFDLNPYKHHNSDATSSIEVRTGTITQLGDIVQACENVDVVYHCISANPMDNRNQSLMWNVNVEGTKKVIEACKQCNVPKLVYVSTASVVFDGSDLLDIDESRPYPRRYIDYYSYTKAEAEKLVLDANKDSMLTCAIRPSSIFGERDPMFVPRLVEAGRKGKTKYIIGNGKTKLEFTYVGNVADACILASEKLTPGSGIGGQAFFITNDETCLFWEKTGLILGDLGYPKPSVCIPAIVCLVIAMIIEIILILISPLYKPSQPLSFTRHRVRLLTTHRQISCSKAKKCLGYQPRVSLDEGMQRTIDYFQYLSVSSTPSSKNE